MWPGAGVSALFMFAVNRSFPSQLPGALQWACPCPLNAGSTTHCDRQTRSWKFPKPSLGGSTSLIENRGSISMEQKHFDPSSFKHKSCYIAWRCLVFRTVSRITSILHITVSLIPTLKWGWSWSDPLPGWGSSLSSLSRAARASMQEGVGGREEGLCPLRAQPHHAGSLVITLVHQSVEGECW